MSKKLMIGLAIGVIALLGIVARVTRDKPSEPDESASSFNVPTLTQLSRLARNNTFFRKSFRCIELL